MRDAAGPFHSHSQARVAMIRMCREIEGAVTAAMDPENVENFRGFPEVPGDGHVDIPWRGAMLYGPSPAFVGVDYASAEDRMVNWSRQAQSIVASELRSVMENSTRETVEIRMNSLAMTLNPTDRVWMDGREYVVTAVVQDSISLVAVEEYVKPEPKPEPKPVYVEQPTGKRMLDVTSGWD